MFGFSFVFRLSNTDVLAEHAEFSISYNQVFPFVIASVDFKHLYDLHRLAKIQ